MRIYSLSCHVLYETNAFFVSDNTEWLAPGGHPNKDDYYPFLMIILHEPEQITNKATATAN